MKHYLLWFRYLPYHQVNFIILEMHKLMKANSSHIFPKKIRILFNYKITPKTIENICVKRENALLFETKDKYKINRVPRFFILQSVLLVLQIVNKLFVL